MKAENDIVITDELIARYLAGEAGAEEAAALNDWLTAPGNQSYFQELQAAWEATFPSKKGRLVNKTEAWKKLERQIDKTPKRGTTRIFKLHRYALRIAASLFIVLAGSLIFFYIRNTNEKISEINVSTQELLREVGLPDQSVAVLYRNSAISYPEKFGQQNREVQLVKGEAFFNVTPGTEKPFLIHTPVAHIKVVGTSFNVTLKNDQLEVGVSEGRVLVYTDSDSSYLSPGFTAVVQARLKSINVNSAVNVNSWGYATRKFVFNDASLTEVISAFEKAYPFSIELTDNGITNCKLTATFDNVPAENVINLIAETLNLSFKRNGSVFILEGEGCQ